ncbi:MAG TPA: cadmium-translocating P-type ATPase [Glaciecola sp.]|nr:cadmium-translocating P-type ATPase [Glaciecola sp.]
MDYTCFHCGLAAPDDHSFVVRVFDQPQVMCCPGCAAVAQSIVDNQLTDYYQFRTEKAQRAPSASEQAELLAKVSVYDAPELQQDFVLDQGNLKEVQLTLEGITCAACGWLIERHLVKQPGIIQNTVNVGAARASIKWDPTMTSLSTILSGLSGIGYDAQPFSPEQHELTYQTEHKRFIKQLGLAGIMTMQVMMLSMGFYFDWLGNIDAVMREYFQWISLVLTTPVVFYAGSTFYLGAIKALSQRVLNMDVPVTLAIMGTYIAGIKATYLHTGEVYFESICMFIFFLLTSRFLEHRARYKATEIASNTMKYVPVSATVLAPQTHEQTIVTAKSLTPGQIVLVKAGETIPIDGEIIEGNTHINESMLTGEFEPVTKGIGQSVFGGTINQHNSIIIRVRAELKYALVNQILRLQTDAMSQKPAIAQMADKLSQYFVVAVLLIASITFAVWHTLGNEDAFWITVSILIATCPCALGLATPSALTSAMARLQQDGVLIKQANVLEALTHIDHLVFDKTGTLTQGKFSIVRTESITDITSDRLLSYVASIEAFSEHPIAQAFSQIETTHVSTPKQYLNLGVEGTIDGMLIRCGTRQFMRHQAAIAQYTVLADATIYVESDTQLLGGIWLNDSLKPDTQATLIRLAQYQQTILSGDAQINVETIAKQLPIQHIKAHCTPAQKLAYVRERQGLGEHVLMLGDGINDSPVLAQANVSISVGNASDLAKSASDVIFLQPSLAPLTQLLAIATACKRTIIQNFMWAIGYNLVVLPFAITGILTPWMAALGMSISSIIVVYNSSRLLSFQQSDLPK